MDVKTYWRDQERVRLYHGTSVSNARKIEREGFRTFPDPKGDYKTFFSSSLEQAWGYSRMGGEWDYMSRWYNGERNHILPENERAVIVVEIPPSMLGLTGGGHFATREAYEANRDAIIEICGEDPDIGLEFYSEANVGAEYIVDVLYRMEA